MKFELTDENLLRFNAAGFGTHGAWAFVGTDSYHDMFYGKGVVRHDLKDRWYGICAMSTAALALATAEADGSRDAKKNALLASGAIWGACALHQGYNVSKKTMKSDAVMVGNVAAMAGIAALNFWKGAGGKDKRAKASVK